jgi:hypothetical protein
MPIWLRKFTFNKINDYYKKEKEEYENLPSNDNKSTLVDSSGNINKEAFKAASPKVTSGPKSKVKYK